MCASMMHGQGATIALWGKYMCDYTQTTIICNIIQQYVHKITENERQGAEASAHWESLNLPSRWRPELRCPSE